MNKKILIGVSSILVIIVGIFIYLYVSKDNEKEIYVPKKEEVKTQISGFNGISMMYETGPGTGEYSESKSSTWPEEGYIFNENLSGCENGGELKWDSSNNTVKLLSQGSDRCYVYFDKKITLADVCSNGENLESCIKNYYNATGDMDNALYYHDADLANGAADNSYRYSGANPNNYVCFGSNASICPSDNLYRIIGVFGSEVKLIKWDYANSNSIGTSGAYNSSIYSASTYSNYDGAHSIVNRYYWTSSSNGSNVWSGSALNTTNLNGTYLNSLGSTWSNKIASHTWYVGGHTTSSATPKTWYNAESSGTTWNGKIGLMYVSDYGYAASNSAWTTDVYNYDSSTIKNNNWMYMGMSEWTISRRSSASHYAFRVDHIGVFYSYYVSNYYHAVRPSFYLESTTTYLSGSGTQSDPIRIN